MGSKFARFTTSCVIMTSFALLAVFIASIAAPKLDTRRTFQQNKLAVYAFGFGQAAGKNLDELDQWQSSAQFSDQFALKQASGRKVRVEIAFLNSAIATKQFQLLPNDPILKCLVSGTVPCKKAAATRFVKILSGPSHRFILTMTDKDVLQINSDTSNKLVSVSVLNSNGSITKIGSSHLSTFDRSALVVPNTLTPIYQSNPGFAVSPKFISKTAPKYELFSNQASQLGTKSATTFGSVSSSACPECLVLIGIPGGTDYVAGENQYLMRTAMSKILESCWDQKLGKQDDMKNFVYDPWMPNIFAPIIPRSGPINWIGRVIKYPFDREETSAEALQKRIQWWINTMQNSGKKCAIEVLGISFGNMVASAAMSNMCKDPSVADQCIHAIGWDGRPNQFMDMDHLTRKIPGFAGKVVDEIINSPGHILANFLPGADFFNNRELEDIVYNPPACLTQFYRRKDDVDGVPRQWVTNGDHDQIVQNWDTPDGYPPHSLDPRNPNTSKAAKVICEAISKDLHGCCTPTPTPTTTLTPTETPTPTNTPTITPTTKCLDTGGEGYVPPSNNGNCSDQDCATALDLGKTNAQSFCTGKYSDRSVEDFEQKGNCVLKMVNGQMQCYVLGIAGCCLTTPTATATPTPTETPTATETPSTSTSNDCYTIYEYNPDNDFRGLQHLGVYGFTSYADMNGVISAQYPPYTDEWFDGEYNVWNTSGFCVLMYTKHVDDCTVPAPALAKPSDAILANLCATHPYFDSMGVYHEPPS